MSTTEPRKVFFRTFGCQMNVYDTDKMRAQLAEDGFSTTEDPADADLVVINTCSIRDKAEQKLHSDLGVYRAMRRKGQPMRIAIAGCVAQQEGQNLIDRYGKEVDMVFGPDGVPHVRELVRKAFADEQVLDTTFLELASYPFPEAIDPTAAEKVGGFVTIQKGCDNRCTFCIVPTTRGSEASRSSSEIIEEVRRLADVGVTEVTLLGQNVNSYGLKVPGEKTFSQLIRGVAEVNGISRIRYTSPHPRDMGDDVFAVYRDVPQLVSHVHLPVQSGSSRILRRMKRFYTRERYLEIVNKLREARPDLALTTDVIVGFPGETDEDFEHTMSLLDEAGFVGSYSFKYSPRPGTPALRLKDTVSPEVASARLTRYQNRQRELTKAWTTGHEGQVVRVLVEGPSKHDEGVVAGRTGTNLMVNFPGPLSLVGTELDVRVVRGFTHSTRGERLDAAPHERLEPVA